MLAQGNLAKFGVVAGERGENLAAPVLVPAPRKVVYSADVELVVEEMSAAEAELEEMIRSCKAVLASSEVTSYTGLPRVGLWRVRVPVDRFEEFMKAVANLGEVQRSRTDSQDVTREYSDLDAQAKNLRAEVEGLRELLKRPTEKLADTLAVREQLSKVTRELDVLQGRLKQMDSQVEFSTVTLHVRERKDYQPAGSPSFGATVARVFGRSTEALFECGKGLVLVAVALTPWLPILGLIALPAIYFRRRWLRKHTVVAAE